MCISKIGNGDIQMSQANFDRLTSQPGSVRGAVYRANKDMFDEAERQGKILVKRIESRISIAGNQVDEHCTYFWDVLKKL